MSFYAPFSQYYDVIFPFRDEVYTFLRTHLSSPPKTVLDVGCGTGRYANRFTKDGFETIGIDLDSDMINFARKHYFGTPFYCMNMTEVMSLQLTFDLIFCIGNVAAHLTRELYGEFLRTVHQLLNPNGLWIFQVKNWDYVLKTQTYSFPDIERKGQEIKFLREYSEITTGKVKFDTTLEVKDKILFEESVYLYPVKTAEYLRLHEVSGFSLVGHYSDFKKNKFVESEDKANIFVFQQ